MNSESRRPVPQSGQLYSAVDPGRASGDVAHSFRQFGQSNLTYVSFIPEKERSETVKKIVPTLSGRCSCWVEHCDIEQFS